MLLSMIASLYTTLTCYHHKILIICRRPFIFDCTVILVVFDTVVTICWHLFAGNGSAEIQRRDWAKCMRVRVHKFWENANEFDYH